MSLQTQRTGFFRTKEQCSDNDESTVSGRILNDSKNKQKSHKNKKNNKNNEKNKKTEKSKVYNSEFEINKIRRPVKRGRKKIRDTYLNILSTNAASLKEKVNSFKSEVLRTNAGIFTIQETHYSKKGKIKVDDYELFEAIRQNKEKGGTLIGVHKALKPGDD